ncbi:MAG: TRAP transporter small permease [Paenibacillaceae bacterium]
MLKGIDRLIRGLENFLAVTLIFGIVGIVTAQVVFRFLLSSPLSWSQEIATFFLIWTTLLGMSIAQREKAHIAVNVLVNWLPKYKSILRWVPWVSMLGLYAIFGFGGAEIAIEHYAQKSPVSGMPMWILFAGFPISAILGVWHLIVEVPVFLRKQKGDIV